MFRKSRALWAASLCGFLAAVVFFVIGLARTIHFSRWDPYTRVQWDRLLAAQQPNFAADFFVHSFAGLIAVAALVFLLALGTRTFRLHPTSTVTGVGFLSVAMVLMAVYNVWLAFGKDLVLLRYKSTQDEALRQTLEHLYRAGFLDTPVIVALLACFAIPGFALLGNAFRGRNEKWMAVWPWCWLSAAGLLFAVFALGYGYDRTFAANQFPRTLMLWSHLGLWVLPSITLAICAAWLRRESSMTAQKAPLDIEPSQAKAA